MDSRLTIGVTIDSRGSNVRAALARVYGAGMDCRVESVASAVALIESDRARAIIDAVRAVTARAERPLDQVLVLGVLDDAGNAAEGDAASVAARVAEFTGVTTIAGFSARDRAAGGCGRPLGAICDWIIAHSTQHSRFVLHFDETSRLTHVPARCGPATVFATETGPGVALLDALAAALTHGRQTSDPRGMLAVQGRQIKPLIRRWATHPFFQQDPPRPIEPGDFVQPLVQEVLATTVERGWSVADVLCSGTHFVAACPADAVRRRLGKDYPADQVLLVGEGTQNGFLLRLVEEQFRSLGIATAPLPNIAPESYSAVCAALLACLTLDGVAANLPSITGAAGPRLLGYLTPGTSRNWQQCVEWMHGAVRPAMLRVA